MAIPLHNLDDRQFADMLEELRARIPGYAPGWTNYNASDPGITLLELLTFLTEMVIYRLNRVPSGLYKKFIRLIGETGVPESEAVENLWKPFRAVTPADFRLLALEASPAGVARAYCLADRDLEHHSVDQTGHVTLIIIPQSDSPRPVPDEALRRRVLEYLMPRRLITTRLHVVAPGYVDMGVHFKIIPKQNVAGRQLETRVRKRLFTFLHPISGGPGGEGWPLGKDVMISEVYRLIDETPGVDYARDVFFTLDGNRTDRVPLHENQLPWLTE